MNELVPPEVGVPVIEAVAPSKESPAGNDPDTDHVYEPDPPDADRVCEYAAPRDPEGNDVGEICSDAGLLIEIDNCLTAESEFASTT